MTGRTADVFSGHESFACRYGWLPKLYECVTATPTIFSNEEDAIIALGIGKNMVRSIRFWGDAFGLTQPSGREVAFTGFARQLLDPTTGRDPYLADTASLWRLHWVIATTANLAAWKIAFSEVQDTELTKQRLSDLVHRRAAEIRGAVTATTVAQHIDVFLRTYDAGRPRGGMLLEDTLSCPLQELGLLTVDDAAADVIRFRRGPKPSLDVPAFAFALEVFWRRVAPESRTLSLRTIMFDAAGPGTVFRLDENSVHGLLTAICSSTTAFDVREDGAGGIDLVSRGADPVGALAEVAWQ